ncbi:MAG TPA: hypothetical protein VF142_00170, partial [Longimicrobium sp.]
MSLLRLSAAGALAVPLLSAAVQAQTPAPSTSTARPPATLRATRLQGDVRLDGRLDEGAWQAAAPASDFTQSYP